MDTGTADDAVYLALTFGLAAALSVTLWLRDRRAPPGHGHSLAAGRRPRTSEAASPLPGLLCPRGVAASRRQPPPAPESVGAAGGRTGRRPPPSGGGPRRTHPARRPPSPPQRGEVRP